MQAHRDLPGRTLADIYRPIELAELLGISENTVYAWLRSGVLRHKRVSEKCVFITRAHILAFLDGDEAKGADMEQ